VHSFWQGQKTVKNYFIFNVFEDLFSSGALTGSRQEKMLIKKTSAVA
jgi:hypothetical protein